MTHTEHIQKVDKRMITPMRRHHQFTSSFINNIPWDFTIYLSVHKSTKLIQSHRF